MYQIIIKPIIANIKPNFLKISGDIFCINLDILMILFGKTAHKIPSISKTKPIAIMNSFMPWLLFFAFYNSGISKKFKEVTIW